MGTRSPPARMRATSCFSPLIALDTSRDATHTPDPSHSPWTPFPSSALCSAPPERSSSPPTPFTVATTSSSTSLHAQKLRHVAGYLSIEPRASGGPGAPPSPSPSSSGSAVCRRRFAVTRSPPSPLCCSA
nr:putative protein TPRXL [Aegilops tauschii subsp. strangulata]